MGVGGQHHASAAVPLAQTRYPFTGGWVVSKADLERREYDPRTF
jgi:hypothetical protein